MMYAKIGYGILPTLAMYGAIEVAQSHGGHVVVAFAHHLMDLRVLPTIKQLFITFT